MSPEWQESSDNLKVTLWCWELEGLEDKVFREWLPISQDINYSKFKSLKATICDLGVKMWKKCCFWQVSKTSQWLFFSAILRSLTSRCYKTSIIYWTQATWQESTKKKIWKTSQLTARLIAPERTFLQLRSTSLLNIWSESRGISIWSSSWVLLGTSSPLD